MSRWKGGFLQFFVCHLRHADGEAENIAGTVCRGLLVGKHGKRVFPGKAELGHIHAPENHKRHATVGRNEQVFGGGVFDFLLDFPEIHGTAAKGMAGPKIGLAKLVESLFREVPLADTAMTAPRQGYDADHHDKPLEETGTDQHAHTPSGRADDLNDDILLEFTAWREMSNIK